MSDFLGRAAAVFGSVQGWGIAWPYGLGLPDRSVRRKDPERYEQLLAEQRVRQGVVVEWAERHGLRQSQAGCCPLWLLRKTSRRCPWSSGSCTHFGDEPADRRWLDHMVTWLTNGRPAVVTSAPYGVSEDDERRLVWWEGRSPLRVARGEGWYGLGTSQIVMWHTGRVPEVVPVAGLADRRAEPVPR
jgi:hypothetical protein